MAITDKTSLTAAGLGALRAEINKTGTTTGVVGAYVNTFFAAGSPPAGTAWPDNGFFTNNVMDPGFPQGLYVLGGGRLLKVQASASAPCRLSLYDLIWCSNTITLGSSGSLTITSSGFHDCDNSPRSVPEDIEIFLYAASAITGTNIITITYLDKTGTSFTADTLTVPTMAAKSFCRIAKNVAGVGVKNIDNSGTNTTIASSGSGTFNLCFMKRLTSVRIPIANEQVIQNFELTGMISSEIASAALVVLLMADTATAISFDMQADFG